LVSLRFTEKKSSSAFIISNMDRMYSSVCIFEMVIWTLNSSWLFLFPKKWLKFVHISFLFLCLALLCLSKSASSVQILSHFRLKTKSQDEFIYMAVALIVHGDFFWIFSSLKAPSLTCLPTGRKWPLDIFLRSVPHASGPSW
jgi:hypothetical protein